MAAAKKIYIYGSKKYPEQVLKKLYQYGVTTCSYDLTDEHAIYTVDADCKVHKHGINSYIGQLIFTHPDYEVVWPDPVFKFNIGDRVRFKNKTTDHFYVITDRFAGGRCTPAYKLEDAEMYLRNNSSYTFLRF